METVMSSTDERPTAKVTAEQLAAVRRATGIIDASHGEGVPLAELAGQVGLSPWHLQRLFKRVTGLSPRAYADARRAARFRQALKAGESVAQATYGAGYGSSSRIYERSNALLGMTPASYAKGGRGARIAYALADSPLGRLLVAATERGVCFVALGSDDAALGCELSDEFPEAQELRRDDAAIKPALDILLRYLAGETPHVALPLDVRSTAFQRRVWQELMAIPPGETRSYGEIAERLGAARAHRAVGRACATNPVAIVIPCHRARRADGGMAGYRWGIERKKKLIQEEAQRAKKFRKT